MVRDSLHTSSHTKGPIPLLPTLLPAGEDVSAYVESGEFTELASWNADALDAAIRGLAAVTVTDNAKAFDPAPAFNIEGWIAVHR